MFLGDSADTDQMKRYETPARRIVRIVESRSPAAAPVVIVWERVPSMTHSVPGS